MTISPLVGTKVTATFTVRDDDGVLKDPSTVTILTKDPSGTIASWISPDVSNLSVGVYELQFVVDTKGHWAVRCETTGDPTATEEVYFDVTGSVFP